MGIKGSVKFVNKNRSVFFSTLRANVETYFAEKNISKHADARMITKTVVLLCGYLLPYAAILLFHLPTALLLLLFAIMGFSMAGIGMSIMHDANHGAYSHKKNINKLMSYSLNMLGNTSFNWKFQHNVLHHTYTNIHNMDDDLEGPSAVRFSPHQPLKRIHKYQHIYVFVFYSLLTVNWVVLKDFVQLIRYRKNGVNNVNRKEHIRNIFVLILSKLFYFFYILIVPCVFFNYSFLAVLTGFLIMHMICGLILSITFQLAHAVEHAAFPLPNEHSEMENEWAIHQVNTTVDFARHSRMLNWYLGGLNFQVVHHLFPTICHIHYKELSEIVKNTAKEFGIKYLENPTLMSAIRSHVQTLKRFGRATFPMQPFPTL